MNTNINLTVAIRENSKETCVNYLTAKDKIAMFDLYEKMATAIANGNEYDIMQTARDIINNEKRNNKIDRHESIIADIMEIVVSNTKEGDALQIWHTAAMLEKFYPNLCENHISYGSTCTVAPLGATAVALRRLVENGVFKETTAIKCDTDTMTKVFIRIV